jgi:hypothetical protein
MVRFARLIHRRIRAFWPAFGRGAFGGNLRSEPCTPVRRALNRE